MNTTYGCQLCTTLHHPCKKFCKIVFHLIIHMFLRQNSTIIRHDLLFLRHVNLILLQELTVDAPGVIFDIVSKMVMTIYLLDNVNHEVLTLSTDHAV